MRKISVKESDACVVVHLSEKRVNVYGVGNEFNEEEFILCGKDKLDFEEEIKESVQQYEGLESRKAFSSVRSTILTAVERFKRRRTAYPGILVQSDVITDSAYLILKSPGYGDDMNYRWDYKLAERRPSYY